MGCLGDGLSGLGFVSPFYSRGTAAAAEAAPGGATGELAGGVRWQPRHGTAMGLVAEVGQPFRATRRNQAVPDTVARRRSDGSGGACHGGTADWTAQEVTEAAKQRLG